MSEPSLYVLTMGFILLVCVLLVGTDAVRVWMMRADELKQAKTVTQNLVTLTVQHAQSVVQAADAVLFSLRERVETDGVGAERRERLHQLLVGHNQALSYVHGFNFFNEAGEWVVTSLPSTIAGMNYADRSYFQYHRLHPDRGLLVGPPVRSKADGSMIVTLSRRVDFPDGQFAGVVLATISADYFEAFYRHLDVGRQGVILLAAADGTVIVREPTGGRATALGDVAPLFRTWLLQAPAGVVEYTSHSDGVVRIGAYRKVDGTPLVMEVGLAKAEIMARWDALAATRLSADSLVAVVLAVLGHRLAVQVGKRQRAQRLYRLLADHSSDAITLISKDGARHYVSPSFCVMTGWDRADLLGDGWRRIVVEEDHPAIGAALQRLEAGAPQAVCLYRCRRRDGVTIWTESRLQVVPARQGAPTEYVENIRDVTERRQMEHRLEAANAELGRQARTDGLTGLANRMAFDDALSAEWDRQLRTDRPLSLLMIDVDHFKAFNDTYGHPAGDAALATVASCILDASRRPADVAARYGGEEFVAILPETDAASAAGVAERIRQTVGGHAIAHAGSPAGVVTVSIGLATVTPGSPLRSRKALIDAADAALYRAKAHGRNRVAAAASESVALSG